MTDKQHITEQIVKVQNELERLTKLLQDEPEETVAPESPAFDCLAVTQVQVFPFKDGGYTLVSCGSTIAKSFKFNDAGELAAKYGSFLGTYELARALIDCGKCESVTAKSETIEVEDN